MIGDSDRDSNEEKMPRNTGKYSAEPDTNAPPAGGWPSSTLNIYGLPLGEGPENALHRGSDRISQ